VPAPIVITGPQPAAARQFCTLCAAGFKAAGLAASKTKIELAQKTGGGTVHLPPLGCQLELAVAMGVVALPMPPGTGNAPVIVLAPLCWSHLQAITILDSQLALGSAGQLPGGAHLLGQ
jgi:hypothetical protein